MKLTLAIKLQPRPKQQASLLATLVRANAACTALSKLAWEEQTFRQYDLHKLGYYQIKTDFRLSAQMVVRYIAKVADAYELDRQTRRDFRPQGSIAYDARILRFSGDDAVSLWTIDGRQTIPFRCGEQQRELLSRRKGEIDLVYVARTRTFFLNVVCEAAEAPLLEPSGVLGIDCGSVNLAVDSDGTVYSGEAVEDQRRTYAHRRRNLQRKGTHGARRKLRRIKGKQRCCQKQINHEISKRIVQQAQRTARAIALEGLKGIRARVTARRHQRARLANWSFGQLQSLIGYKARLAGVPVVFVDPRNTSQACPACGTHRSANRPNQSTFSCVSYGLVDAVDHIAALNISTRAGINQPLCPGTASAVALGQSPRL